MISVQPLGEKWRKLLERGCGGLAWRNPGLESWGRPDSGHRKIYLIFLKETFF